MQHATVGFVYNYPCPLKCNFCCHTRENVGPGRLRPANVSPILHSFCQQPEVDRIAFTGGEPFLYFDEILEIMSDMRSKGVTQPFHIVTSGIWADSPEETDSKVEQLHKCGLDLLYVSYDYEHMKWVPKDNIRRIADSCSSRGITLELYGVFWNKDDSLSQIIPDLPNVKKHDSLAMPVGRARSKFGLGSRYGKEDKYKYSCGKPRDYDVVIYPNGDVYPCCSGGFNKEADIACGNAFVDDARSILDNVFSQRVARVAKEIGFDKVVARLEAAGLTEELSIPAFSEVDTVCQICVSIGKAYRSSPAVRDAIKKAEIDYSLKMLEVIPSLVTAWKDVAAKNEEKGHA